MKKIELLKSIFILSILFPSIVLFGCASDADASEIQSPDVIAPEYIEDDKSTAQTETNDNNSNEIIESENAEESATITTQNENVDTESDELFQTKYDTTQFDELPEIEEPIVHDAELPPEEIVEIIEPPVVIPEEKILVEEVTPIPDAEQKTDAEIEKKSQNDNSNATPETEISVIQLGDLSVSDEVENVDTEADLAIDITNDEENLEEEVTEIEIIPSRNVTLRVGEYLEIDYPGKGWVFLGAIDGSKNLTSAGRKLGDKDTNFTLQARNEGTSILHFYKEDILAGVYIDDYIEVTVQAAKLKSKTRVKAPSYAETVPAKPSAKTTQSTKSPTSSTPKADSPAQKKDSTPQNESTKTTDSPAQTATTQLPANNSKTPTTTPQQASAKTTNSPTQNATTQQTDESPLPSAEELFKSAKSNFDAKNYDSAKKDLELFLTVADKDRDEALYLLGQIYESNSKNKDIKKAIEAYEKLMDNYPTSKYWDEANKRVIYLKRFYINVR